METKRACSAKIVIYSASIKSMLASEANITKFSSLEIVNLNQISDLVLLRNH